MQTGTRKGRERKSPQQGNIKQIKDDRDCRLTLYTAISKARYKQQKRLTIIYYIQHKLLIHKT